MLANVRGPDSPAKRGRNHRRAHPAPPAGPDGLAGGPWRDTPSRLASIAEEWQLDEESRVLSGDVDRVELVLSAWQVPRSRNTVTGELIHPALAYVVSPEGKITHLVDGSVEATLLALEESGRR